MKDLKVVDDPSSLTPIRSITKPVSATNDLAERRIKDKKEHADLPKDSQ